MVGMVNSKAGEFDLGIAFDLQNDLMAEPNTRPIDLAAFNVNRGRDHGLQPYVKYLEYCTVIVAESFDDLSPIVKTEELERLKSVYQ
jgi:peroxidase